MTLEEATVKVAYHKAEIEGLDAERDRLDRETTPKFGALANLRRSAQANLNAAEDEVRKIEAARVKAAAHVKAAR